MNKEFKSLLNVKRQRPFDLEYLENEWTCPITSEPMKKPVITDDGHSYQRYAIEKWLSINQTSPKTGLKLPSKRLIRNIDLQHVIQTFNNQTKYQIAKVLEINEEFILRLQNYKQALVSLNKIKSEVQSQNQKLQTNQRQLQKKYQNLDQDYKKLSLKYDDLLDKHQVSKISNEAKINALKEKNKILMDATQKQFKKANQILQLDSNGNQCESEYAIFQLSREQYEQDLKKNYQRKQKSMINQSFSCQRGLINTQSENQMLNFLYQEVNQQKLSFSSKKNLLPFSQYIKRNPVQYDFQENQLDHMEWPINMQKFLKYDWSLCKTLKLNNCRIEDKAFDKFLKEAHNFTSLENLFLHNNRIIEVPQFSLENFKKLKVIHFCQNQGTQNPLNKRSLRYLDEFKNKSYIKEVLF